MEQKETLSQTAFDRLLKQIHVIRDKAIDRNDREALRDAEYADALLYQFANALDIERLESMELPHET